MAPPPDATCDTYCGSPWAKPHRTAQANLRDPRQETVWKEVIGYWCRYSSTRETYEKVVPNGSFGCYIDAPQRTSADSRKEWVAPSPRLAWDPERRFLRCQERLRLAALAAPPPQPWKTVHRYFRFRLTDGTRERMHVDMRWRVRVRFKIASRSGRPGGTRSRRRQGDQMPKATPPGGPARAWCSKLESTARRSRTGEASRKRCAFWGTRPSR